MPLSPGSRLGPYEVVDLLGAGAMGEVYHAHDPTLERDVQGRVDGSRRAVAEHGLDAIPANHSPDAQTHKGRVSLATLHNVKTAPQPETFPQRMIGTVPPSALHAAPVTYEARSEQRKTITAAISSGRASRPSGRPAPTFARTTSRSPC